MALTEKQKSFCRNIVSGMGNKDAYLTAYNTSCKDTTAWTEATKLLNKDEIQTEIKRLSKPLEIAAQNNALNARQKQIDFIQSRIDYCLTTGDEQSIIRYTDMLNKINALYKDTEQEQKPETIVNNIDLDTLKRLSGAS